MKKKPKLDLYFLGFALLFFILGGIYENSLAYLGGWAMIVSEIIYLLKETW